MVKRLFVEKKPGFDIEAKGILADLRDNLGMLEVESVRLLCRYDVSGISDEDFEKAKKTIFSEPNADYTYDEEFPIEEGQIAFAVEFLPGQFDQRADSAAQCVQLLTQGEPPIVNSAKVYVLSGKLDDTSIDAIKSYMINPVESREASSEKPETLERSYDIPEDVAILDKFIFWNKDELRNYYDSMGFAMTYDDLVFCRDYFRDVELRNPTVTELRVIDTYWSDHCRHTTFLTRLDEIKIEDKKRTKPIMEAMDAYLDARHEVYGDAADNRPMTLMDMATIGAKAIKKRGKLADLDESDEINACSIEVPAVIDGKSEQWLVQFKNETHNHPTEIEPFGGAATCLGGAIRDPLSGRSYVYQAMRVTGAGDPRIPVKDTLEGKLPQRKITTGAAAGYSSYGNQIGLATGQVTELYDDGYVAKRMEIGAVVGASPKENVVRSQPQPGDIVVLLGGRTGRDGCGGATGSSKAHDLSSLESCGAEVQKGNPPTERKIQRLFRNPDVSRLIKRCNDFGAGGVCVAIGELADGISVRLDDVRLKYNGLDGTELAISESQERMAVVLDKKDVDFFIEQAKAENLEAYAVAWITENPRLRMKWRDKVIVDISREFLNTNGVTQHAKAKILAPEFKENYRTTAPTEMLSMSISDAFIHNLSRLQVCAQKGLVERFDGSIGAASVLMPFGGKYQLTPEESMVAKLPVGARSTDCATAMSFGGNPAHMRVSPFHGAAYAVVESLSKLAAVGADPMTARLTFQEYFERLGDKSTRWGKPAAALLGALTAQLKLDIPSIGGKDSMSGSFNDLDVPPTLVSFAIAMTSAERTISAAFKKSGSKVVFLPIPESESRMLPCWKQLAEMYKAVFSMSCAGDILSASVVREGGIAACVSRMSFGNGFGFEFAEGISSETLFSPQTGALVLELKDGAKIPENIEAVEIGTTNEKNGITVAGTFISADQLKDAWMSPLEPIFPVVPSFEPEIKEVPLYTKRNSAPAFLTRCVEPKVFIPAFPGTNCELDCAKAFKKAGANPQVFVMRNLTANDIEESINEMARLIKDSQMIMLPGGFSAGDEPDGSGKFIATTFRNPIISDAVAELLQKRDGLILGICNGFQALIKLGLLPYGEIRDIAENDPTLTFNSLGRHVSRMTYTRVASVKSPWLAGCEAGDIHCIPVSHGEGRFVADEATMLRLIENGQVATQYCAPDGAISASVRWNPNGSLCAVEGITSPDGRVLGKMGHSERCGENLLKNIPGNNDQKLFESGVKYFR
ncbi:MAG: phosphoribosylformylglycinamidine synthase [Ruminococcaceae bacterium]|nr:phosphoribosylformylglycinamidine synthase [Oscillospiraceae bacterium]